MERPEKLYTAWDELVAREWADRGYLSWEEVREMEYPGVGPVDAREMEVVMRSLVSRQRPLPASRPETPTTCDKWP